jgi:alginate O-acetyltransferase complex protein AlgI
MLFSEPAFFVFFAGYFLLHLITPPRWRVWLIIAGSTIFYAWWRVEYVPLPFLLAIIGWAGVRWIEAAAVSGRRKLRIALTIVALFTPLAIVKYGYFILANVLGLLAPDMASHHDFSAFKFALPLGVSFITFSVTAYVVDVYRGRYLAENRLSIVLGYVLFFPHLIAGPILRPNEVMPQLGQLRAALGARFTLGIALFALGLVKKVVFADTIAPAVEHAFANGATPTSWECILAVYGFSMQIYCDFSGYTDMAIGVAYLLRIRLPTNFLRPYCSGSIIEFWRRWHITLSFWLRDYLYIALGGNRAGSINRYRNLLATMVLGGLWHGAAWTFVVWGLLHGLALAGAHFARQFFPRMVAAMPRWLGLVLTFHFVALAWIYFRAPNIESAHRVLGALLRFSPGAFDDFARRHVFELLLLGIFALSHRYDRHAFLRLALQRVNKSVVWAVVGAMFVLAIAIGQGSSGNFIYFDF